MEKLNIAELLKDCPSGMELDCTMYDNATLLGVDNIDSSTYPIQILIGDDRIVKLSKYGEYIETKYAKCVIFPKGKTTWEGFQRPFKDGDIITCTNHCCTFVAIYKGMCNKDSFYRYACLILDETMHFNPNTTWSDFTNPRFATEEEKEKLFQAIKENGYRWNVEKKELEKLIVPKFKVGDRVKHKESYISGVVTEIDGECYKVKYDSGAVNFANIKYQDDWELVPNKFDISTLVPFESRVLVRDYESHKWRPAIWGLKTNDIPYPYIVIGGEQYNCCIPYESNEHLLGTTNNCPDFYKTWEK